MRRHQSQFIWAIIYVIILNCVLTVFSLCVCLSAMSKAARYGSVLASMSIHGKPKAGGGAEPPVGYRTEQAK